MDALQLAVVGLGGWGKNVVGSFGRANRCQLRYVCDTQEQSLQRQSRLFPAATPTDDYESILRDESVDAVAIATPAHLHFDMARRALAAGKHVYVEKPMTLGEQDAERLVGLADEVGRKLMVGHLLEYHPAVETIKQKVQAGELGDLYYMYCQRLNLGVVRQHENAFWSLAPHDISVILYLFEMEPERVVATGQSFLQSGIEDVVFVTMHFPDGRMAQIHVSWLDPHKERKMVLVGADKMLVFDDMQPTEKIRLFDKCAEAQAEVAEASGLQAINVRHGDIHIPRISTAPPLDRETQHFVDCVLDNRPIRSDGEDGLRVVRILEEVDSQLKRLRLVHAPHPPLQRRRVAA